MAQYQLGIALFILTFALTTVQFSTSHVLKGSVTCLDCNNLHPHLSGIKVSVKCSQVKELGMATTQEDGSFETNLPFETSPATKCYAKILGGPNQLFISRKDMVVKSEEDHAGDYTISMPLRFYTRCPLVGKPCVAFGSSKTVDLPVPKEWGIAPTSYYFPFVPIIGIP